MLRLMLPGFAALSASPLTLTTPTATGTHQLAASLTATEDSPDRIGDGPVDRLRPSQPGFAQVLQSLPVPPGIHHASTAEHRPSAATDTGYAPASASFLEAAEPDSITVDDRVVSSLSGIILPVSGQELPPQAVFAEPLLADKPNFSISATISDLISVIENDLTSPRNNESTDQVGNDLITAVADDLLTAVAADVIGDAEVVPTSVTATSLPLESAAPVTAPPPALDVDSATRPEATAVLLAPSHDTARKSPLSHPVVTLAAAAESKSAAPDIVASAVPGAVVETIQPSVISSPPSVATQVAMADPGLPEQVAMVSPRVPKQRQPKAAANKVDSIPKPENSLLPERVAIFDVTTKPAMAAGNTSLSNQPIFSEPTSTGFTEGNTSSSGYAGTAMPVSGKVENSSGAVDFSTADSNARTGSARVAVPFTESGWGQNLGRQLTVLVSRNLEHVRIQLDPPELGPLQVRIQVQNDQVTLHFSSQHAVVREALEQTVMRLQQLFSEEGMDLIDVNVSDRESSQQQQSTATPGDGHEVVEAESDDILTQSVLMPLDEGKIDYFI